MNNVDELIESDRHKELRKIMIWYLNELGYNKITHEKTIIFGKTTWIVDIYAEVDVNIEGHVKLLKPLIVELGTLSKNSVERYIVLSNCYQFLWVPYTILNNNIIGNIEEVCKLKLHINDLYEQLGKDRKMPPYHNRYLIEKKGVL